MPQQPKQLSYFHVMTYMLTGGRAYRGDENSAAGFLQLTSTGRKTGKQRKAHLLYIRDGSDYVITASNGGRQRNPGWFFNVQSLPDVTMRVHGIQRRAVAEVAGPEKRKELWARLLESAAMYAGYAQRTTREIPMVLLHPVEEAEAKADS